MNETLPTRRRIWPWLLLAALVLTAGVLTLLWRAQAERRTPTADHYIVQVVDSGPLRRTINATGPLNPVNLVQVGTQVSGTIRALHADYNSPVRAGQLLAELDTTALDADLAQAQAQVRGAESALAAARLRLARSEDLVRQGFVSAADSDDKRAAVESADATLAQTRAAAARAANNRRNAEIRSPVGGTVVASEVAVGQTVAASLQTPVLFRIAQDLRDVQVEMNVSEADVGLMREGQTVRFSVDAFPERSFEGRVHQVRNNQQTIQNVVTYTVIVRARNEELLLRPGMTCYVSIVVAERPQVLRLPNAALRYAPTGQAATDAGRGAQRTVWRLDPQGRPQPVEVKLGIADGRHTELLGDTLRAGEALVVGERGGAGFAGPRIF